MASLRFLSGGLPILDRLASLKGVGCTMNLLSWNCQGSAGSLRSSTMQHLARLITSTKSQVCFISETRNTSISRTAIVNRFNVLDAFVVQAQGQSGGLWLIWTQAVSITIIDHNYHYILALCNSTTTSEQFGLVCIYGDPHHRNTTTIWTRVLNFVVNHSTLPILAMGDMNELMNANEKCGSGKADIRRINMFCDYVKQCGFLDLGYSGPAYTWTNKRFSTTPTFQRLDRCLANAEWCMAYPRTTVYHLPMRRSDHAPILTMLDSTRHHNNKIFRFKNWWLMEQDYMQVAKESWMKSYNRPFHQKTKYLATDLRKWRMAKPNLSTQINIIESQMLSQPSEPPQEQDYDLQQHLAFQHQNILTKDEEFHLQRAKKNWARLGDRNTAFFHQSIVKRHRKNTIAYLHNPDGTDSTTADQIASTLLHYFHELFAVNETNHQSLQTSSLQILTASHSQQPQPQEASHHHSMRQGEEIDHHHQTIDSRHTNAADDISCFTNSTPNLQELHSIIKGMRNNASPGPDSLNAAFFKTAWPWISNDVHNLHFINLLRACFTTPSMAVLINGEPTGYFFSKKGIRQGCPLSPFLFAIAINELSIALHDAMNNANLTGITLGPNCPPIQSLLFADDLILCGEATIYEATTINNILNDFYYSSGQTPNMSKSSIHFRHNVDNATKTQIKNIFPVPNLLHNTIHLGHPIIFSHRDKNKAYAFIYNKFLAKLTTVKANKLNHAGRLTTYRTTCGQIEDDAHLFFLCSLPRAVWFSFTPSLRTELLPPDNDGIQLILQTIITNDINDDLLSTMLITLRFIWKARNDNCFQRKSWTPIQVHTAAAAMIRWINNECQETEEEQAPCLNHDQQQLHQQPTPPIIENSTGNDTNLLGQQGMSYLTAGDQSHQRIMTNNERAPEPPTMTTIDASTLPDQPNMSMRQAGLGIFFLNTRVQPAQGIYIKAKLEACSSVLMAEAASLALASIIIDRLNIDRVSFLSDSELLVHFFNQTHHNDPPDWRIKHFTQTFSNHIISREPKIFKVKRSSNSIADTLAREAFLHRTVQSNNIQYSCSHEHHKIECPLTQVLHFVDLINVTIIAARCC
ncbi:uncharacterized protein LOC8083452 isoform X2 [Sorghum bicolor]|uniref:uncharacterized protein LOC8083452 isoform X2 n=1 Tax=Sorghum bicolor TaxID=4558 RepID=UPI000B426684|nr:uncharacterized protein LOC8083452 isoform X2 [Sorghum bicolor]|eukprot:XP_021318754.1 uncharacterized protein LOC8083452 isoform X2 [Sorghum bicolor]